MINQATNLLYFFIKSAKTLQHATAELGAVHILTVSLILTSCADYSIMLNDNLIYNPPSIFTDFKLADFNLQACVDNTIADEHLTAAEQLTRLYCTKASIISLENIEIFTNLRQLGLADNHLTGIQPLTLLTHLQHLNLAGNQIFDASPLAVLTKLTYLDLSNNKTLECNSIQKLIKLNIDIKLPEHCQDNQT